MDRARSKSAGGALGRATTMPEWSMKPTHQHMRQLLIGIRKNEVLTRSALLLVPTVDRDRARR
eukprot:11027837-Alexandrium_andersonii.AAC.1